MKNLKMKIKNLYFFHKRNLQQKKKIFFFSFLRINQSLTNSLFHNKFYKNEDLHWPQLYDWWCQKQLSEEETKSNQY